MKLNKKYSRKTPGPTQKQCSHKPKPTKPTTHPKKIVLVI